MDVSEQRQLVLLLVGLLVLTTVGIVGASLFPEPCEGLEQLGDLELRFADAVDAVPLAPDEAAAVEALGEDLGIGAWRGAVALPDDALVTRSEFGFFVADADGFVVLRPSLGIGSAGRGRSGLDVFPAGSSLLLRAEDGEAAVVNGEYEVDRCGTVPPATDVATVDRGFAVVSDGAGATLVTLSGDEVWATGSELAAAHITGDVVLLRTEDGLVARDVRDEAASATLLEDAGDWLDAFGDRVLLTGDAPGAVVLVEVVDGAAAAGSPTASGLDEVLHATLTPRGMVTAGVLDGELALATDAGGLVVLDAPVDLRGVLASEDGHVGLRVVVDGTPALLVYGPDNVT